MSTTPSHDRNSNRPVAKTSKLDESPASSTRLAFEQRCEANRIGGLVRCDPRTVLRALRMGIDAIKHGRLREELRPHVEAWKARGGRAA